MIGNTRPGIPTDIKLMFCLKILRYGGGTDQWDDAAYMSEESGRLYLMKFCKDIIDMYGSTYLKRYPNVDEMDDITERFAIQGFPGCAGALDCMKLFWKNCPVQDKGQNLNPKGHSRLATIQCEAWCDYDLYFWHWYSGRSGTNNDLNVLARSPLFRDVISNYYKMERRTEYQIIPNGRRRRRCYLLADGIYPDYPIFAKPIHDAPHERQRWYSKIKESVRKTVERFFGVLQSRFEYLRRENRKWELSDVITISQACVILQNKIVRMHQNGEFHTEAGAENLVLEFCEADTENRIRSEEEMRQNRNTEENSIMPDWESELERMVMREAIVTDPDLFYQLEAELVRNIELRTDL